MGKKKITSLQMKSIYNAARKSYDSSYAMMVDDIFEGAKKKADKLGIETFYDSSWFHDIAAGVRSFSTWENLSQNRKEDMLRSINGEDDDEDQW